MLSFLKLELFKLLKILKNFYFEIFYLFTHLISYFTIFLKNIFNLKKISHLLTPYFKKINKSPFATIPLNILLFILINSLFFQIGGMNRVDLKSDVIVKNNFNFVDFKNNFDQQKLSLKNVLNNNGEKDFMLSKIELPESYFQISAWIPYWSLTEGLDTSILRKNQTNDISLFLFNVNKDGTVENKSPSLPIDLVSKRVRSSGEKIYATITEELNASQFLALIKNNYNRETLINNILTISQNFDGVDLDFEAINFNSSTEEMTELRIMYPEFAQELKERLHQEDKTLSVTVGARISRDDPNWSVYDYQSLALASDQIKVMAYDYHNNPGNPGPVTSYKWVSDILDYMLKSIKPEKITIGLPTYGYQYGSDGSKKALTGEQIQKLSQNLNLVLQRDEIHRTPYYKYTNNGVSYIIHFADQQFYFEMLTLLKSKGLNQIALWSIGTEDTTLWDVFLSI